MSDKNELLDNIGTCLILLTVAILVILFSGEPDVGDAIRLKALEWAGISEAVE